MDSQESKYEEFGIPTKCGDLRVNGHVIISNRPCKILAIATVLKNICICERSLTNAYIFERFCGAKIFTRSVKSLVKICDKCMLRIHLHICLGSR